MGKDTRKPRKKFCKTMDITKPITLEQLGTKDDPCFSKLHDPRNGDCQRCGDNEFCALAMGQLTHIKRLEVEAKQNFKDLEEKEVYEKLAKQDPIKLKKEAKRKIREIIKRSSKVGIAEDEIVNDIFAAFSKDGYTKSRIKKLLTYVASKSEFIEFSKTTHKYTWNKK